MKNERIILDHGSGGEAARELVKEIILSHLDNPYLRKLDDSAVIDSKPGRMAMTTDSYVVDPYIFPGGDIGSLAVHGTVNDLAMQGAEPAFLTLGLILEEGLLIDDLSRIMESAAMAAEEAGIEIVAGDTKVVPKNRADCIYINTSGIGWIIKNVDVSCNNAIKKDIIIINGTIGDHGIAILSKREGLDFESPVVSDSSPLNGLVSRILKTGAPIHVLRDPTRGGVSAALNEIAEASGVGMRLFEEKLPVKPAVATACEMLGLDPLYIANEGKCLVIAPEACAIQVLDAMKSHPFGKDACIIGEVIDKNPGSVVLKTCVGGTRILSTPTGEQLPRIC